MDPEFLADLREFLEDQADAEYLPDSPAPRPNKAMRLLTQLNEFEMTDNMEPL